jgi:hypothetical protein
LTPSSRRAIFSKKGLARRRRHDLRKRPGVSDQPALALEPLQIQLRPGTHRVSLSDDREHRKRSGLRGSRRLSQQDPELAQSFGAATAVVAVDSKFARALEAPLGFGEELLILRHQAKPMVDAGGAANIVKFAEARERGLVVLLGLREVALLMGDQGEMLVGVRSALAVANFDCEFERPLVMPLGLSEAAPLSRDRPEMAARDGGLPRFRGHLKPEAPSGSLGRAVASSQADRTLSNTNLETSVGSLGEDPDNVRAPRRPRPCSAGATLDRAGPPAAGKELSALQHGDIVNGGLRSGNFCDVYDRRPERAEKDRSGP